jgi:hypothetical protein
MPYPADSVSNDSNQHLIAKVWVWQLFSSMARAFKETNLQEYKGLQISKGGRDSPGNVVLV